MSLLCKITHPVWHAHGTQCMYMILVELCGTKTANFVIS